MWFVAYRAIEAEPTRKANGINVRVTLYMKVSAKYSICFLFCLIATACGGGGGNSSSSSSGGTTASQQPPPLPMPVYSGISTAAQLSPFIGGQVTAFVFADVDIAASFSQNLISPFLQGGYGPISSTQAGPMGGQVVLTGYVNGNTTGWVVEDFSDYSFQPQNTSSSVTLNGQLLVEVTGASVTYGYTNYEAKGSGFDTVLSGTATQMTQAPTSAGGNQTTTTTTTLNIGILDRVAGFDEEFSNFTLVSQSGPNIVVGADVPAIDRTFTGRVYDSAVGYVDMQTQGTEIYVLDPTKLLPIYGANVLVSGSNNTTALQIGPLNYYFFSVGISTQNNGVFEASARYNWNGFTVDTTPAPVGTGPVAVAEESSSPAVGVPISLDGRFSHSPSGDYLHMNWSLLYATPGSHPVLANASMPEASLIVDEAGDYLVLLTVTDGAQSAQHTVIVSVPSTNTPTESFPMFETVAGPDVTGTIGTPVLLDGRASFDAFDDGNAPTYNWQLIAPPGSKATLSDPTSAQPSFTPDISGYYHVLLNYSTAYLNVFENPSAQSLTVTVGEPIAFRPPVQLDGSLNKYLSPSFYVVDMNADGKPDVLLYPLIGSSNSMNLYLNTGGGTFAAPAFLSAPGNSDNGLFATVADLNGDGRLDIVMSGVNTGDQDSLFVFLQNPDGSFATPQAYIYPNPIGFPNPVTVGRLFGSNTLSVVVLSCGGLCDFPVNSDGTLQAPSSINLPSFLGVPFEDQFKLVDFNDDGLADLLSGGLYTANSNDTFSVFNNQDNPVTEVATTGDLYGDGHNELITAGPTSLQVFSEAGTNPIAYPLTANDPPVVSFGDLNGDGLGDVVLVYPGDCNTYGAGVCIHSLGLLYQQANHSFGPEIFVPVDGLGSGPLWIGDLNGDGVPDLMYTSSGKPVIQFGYKP